MSHDPYAPHRVHVLGGDRPQPTDPPRESTGNDEGLGLSELTDEDLREELRSYGVKIDSRWKRPRLEREVTAARSVDAD